MNYIDLNTITVGHVIGKWRVESRVVSRGSNNNLFSHAKTMELDNSSYKAKNGLEYKGEWHVVREKELIYNPQLKFFMDSIQAGNAIITKFLQIDEGDNKTELLTLYFSDGLELVLKKDN